MIQERVMERMKQQDYKSYTQFLPIVAVSASRKVNLNYLRYGKIKRIKNG